MVSPPRRTLGLVLSAVVCLGALLGSPHAQADKGDTWLDLNLTSFHTEQHYWWEGEMRRYNNRNLGLGFTHEFADWLEVKGGFFENSYDKTSVYAVVGLDYDLVKSKRWVLAPGVAGGFVTGYDDTPEQADTVAPWGMLSMTIGYANRWRLNLGYLPSRLFDVGTVDLVTVQVGIRL